MSSELNAHSASGMVPDVEIVVLSSEFDASTRVIRFFNFDEAFYAPYLTAMMNHLPKLLTALTPERYQEQIDALAEIYFPSDGYAVRDMERLSNGLEYVEHYFNTVPLLTAAQVLAQLNTNDLSALGTLQSVKYQDRTFYPADQFGEDGQPLAEHAHIQNILRQDKSSDDWFIALWWVTPSGRLKWLPPIDLFLDSPAEVQVAAEKEIVGSWSIYTS